MTLCPLDEKDDLIQRIEALILEDQVVSSRGGAANSALAAALAPPEKPKRRKKDFAEKYAQWEKAAFKWQRLFYCRRCGIVFEPETGEHCLPGELNEFLYRKE
jgi:hypothetical protein